MMTQMKLSDDAIRSLKGLIRQALHEDLSDGTDCTSQALFPHSVSGSARFISRVPGILSGIAVVREILDEVAATLELSQERRDGDALKAGDTIARLSGDTRQILLVERTCLNFLGHLSGIATLTARFVELVQGTTAKIFDTRKTTPGWRLLEKYAVLCGGGNNHRMGLYDAILIKDNHLAMLTKIHRQSNDVEAFALKAAREWIDAHVDRLPNGRQTILQIEVDNLQQFERAISQRPSIVLLDNMSLDEMSEANRIRHSVARDVELEASGGITLATVNAVAKTGVDRISVGALTHSSLNFDIGLDWELA